MDAGDARTVPPECERVTVDPLDEAALREAVSGCAFVLHCARDDRPAREARFRNVEGARLLYRACSDAGSRRWARSKLS